MTDRELELANKIMIAHENGDTSKFNLWLTELSNSLDDNYKNKIINIIRNKYTFAFEDREEGAKDLYSEACVIFLQNLKRDINLLADLKYESYMIGICKNLYFEKTRKTPVKNYQDAYQFDNKLATPEEEENPFESEQIQRKVEDALISYYESNKMIDCLKILYYSWKKEYKNHDIAAMMNIQTENIKEASRRVSVIQQNCIKKAWRNIGLLQEIKKEYNIKKRNKIYWGRNA